MILCLETATKNCSVGLFHNGSLLGIREERGAQFIHGEQLHLFVKEVLESTGTDKSQLTGIMVSRGPGSYTGLRIGVSAAKGLAYALAIPLLSAPTLGCFDLSSVEESVALTVLDARRDEVYYQAWRKSEGQWIAFGPTDYEIVTPDSWSHLYQDGPVAVLGDCTQKVATLLGDRLSHFRIAESSYPSARFMSGFLNNAVEEDVAYFEPFYLKDFVAVQSKKKLL